ncbi:MAG: biopolymer transporter [Blastochloris sp.]|nr:biopolymer transporter [Blastochloris sp.]
MMLSFVPLPFLASGGVTYAFQNADFAGKVIIFILLTVSVFTWSVLWTKVNLIRQAKKENLFFLKRYRNDRSSLDLYTEKKHYPSSPLSFVYQAGARELSFHLLGSSTVDETFRARLEDADKVDSVSMASVRSAMERAVGEQALAMESQLILLSTAASGGPFLGLLGTVWGVMEAFSGIALAGQASLSALAPGVSGALITTVTGLVVAIPAMFGYNFLITTIRAMIVEMENFSAECGADFEHRYLKSRS